VAAALVACVPTEKKNTDSTDSGSPMRQEPVSADKARPQIRAPVRDTPMRAHFDAPTRPGVGTPPQAVEAPAPSGAGDPLLTEPFRDGFERRELGGDWYATSPVWRIQGGRLCGSGARNRPVWLKRRLPANARIEFDATSSSPDGDLKVEVWGDGKSFAQTTSYTNASSYVVIFGGWKNQFHVLARIDEHAPGRPEVRIDPASGDVRSQPVKAGQAYHFKIERSDGKTIRWLVDDIEILSFTDPKPLKGAGHDHIGFNDWEVPVCFDNLVITPVGGG
jgi:hypothetical protein